MKESVTSPWALEQWQKKKNQINQISFSHNTKDIILFIYLYLGLGSTQV